MPYFDEDEDEALNNFISSKADRARPQLGYEEELPPPTQPSALDRLKVSQQEDDSPWDAVTNYGVPAIAALLDTATNKGRGVGTILQSAALQANQRSVGKRELAAEKLKFLTDDAERAQRSKYYDYLDRSLATRTDQGASRIANQSEGLDLRKQRQDYDLNPDNAQAQRGVAKTKELAGVDLEGMNSRQQGQLQPTVGRIQGAALAPVTAGKVKQTQIDTDLANAPEVNANAADKVAGETAARVQATSDTERAIGADTAIANAEVADPKVWAGLNDAQRAKAMASAQAHKVFGSALETMKELSAKHGVQNMPSADKSAYDAAHGAALGQLAELYRTGVIGEKEYGRMKDRLPESGGIKSNAAAAVGWVTNQPNILGDMLGGGGDETMKELAAGMSQFGLRPPGQARPPAATGGQPQQRQSFGPDVDHPSNLGVQKPLPQQPGVTNAPRPGGQTPQTQVTGGPPSAAQLPRNQDGTYNLPGGKRPYTAQDVQRLIAMGRLAP